MESVINSSNIVLITRQWEGNCYTVRARGGGESIGAATQSVVYTKFFRKKSDLSEKTMGEMTSNAEMAVRLKSNASSIRKIDVLA